MPTNVSTPIWRCDICGTRFDADYDAACRCESAGPPDVLPDGELLLEYGAESWSKWPGFTLQPLYRDPDRIGTVASHWKPDTGHVVHYCVGVQPLNDDGTRRWTASSGIQKVESRHLRPHRAGHVNLSTPYRLGKTLTGRETGEVTDWVLAKFGLGYEGLEAGASVADWARPLTPEVAAVLDALGASAVTLPGPAHPRFQAFRYYLHRPAGAVAAKATAGTGRPASSDRMRWWLRSTPAGELVETINDQWARWRAGEPIEAPAPALRCSRQLHASKLPKQLKELVAVTGVPWPTRTSSDEYVRLLIRTLLEYKMETTDKLFDGPRVVAVTGTKGGVGKSTTAAALAMRLARDGQKVVLVDCDLNGPSQHLLFGLGPAHADPHTRRVVPSATATPGLSVFSPGQLFSPEERIAWDAKLTADWMSFIGSSLDLDDVDIVVVDLPPGADAMHGIIFAPYRVNVTVALHVTTGHPLALADTERGLQLQVPDHHGPRHHRILVENLSRAAGTTADGAQVEIRLAGQDGASQALAEKHDLEWGGSLPWAATVEELADADEMADLARLVCPAG